MCACVCVCVCACVCGTREVVYDSHKGVHEHLFCKRVSSKVKSALSECVVKSALSECVVKSRIMCSTQVQ